MSATEENPPRGKERRRATDAQMIEALKEVEDQLRGLRADVALVVRRYATQRVIIGTLVFTLVALGLLVVDNRQNALEACRRDNELRQANTALWTPILADSPQPTLPPSPTPEQQSQFERQIRQRENFEKALASGFAVHDC